MKKGKSTAEIAETLGRDRSTIYREIRRNSVQGNYQPVKAQILAAKRRLACRPPRKLDDAQTREYVRCRLESFWSPEQIAGRRQCDLPRQRSQGVSRQTIYNWIKTEAPEWQVWLRRSGRPPEKRGRMTDWSSEKADTLGSAGWTT